MYTALVLLSLVYAVVPIHSPIQEGLINFNSVSKCVLGYNALKYNGYGCWCGKGGSGTPVDGIDECCKQHDLCYDRAVDNGACSSTFWEYLKLYKWKCVNHTAICKKNKNRCARALCECDTECVKCWSKYPKPNSKKKCRK